MLEQNACYESTGKNHSKNTRCLKANTNLNKRAWIQMTMFVNSSEKYYHLKFSPLLPGKEVGICPFVISVLTLLTVMGLV